MHDLEPKAAPRYGLERCQGFPHYCGAWVRTWYSVNGRHLCYLCALGAEDSEA